MQSKMTIAILTLYAAAMALLESAVVVYMRRLYYPVDPNELFPLIFLDSYDPTLELCREFATILMIIAVALLVERRNATRCFAAFVFVFGVWDLLYYFWLKVLIDWPQSWLEWDVLFLIPCLWLGPWICPAMIALLFTIWGYWALRTPMKTAFDRNSLGLFVVGATLGLVTFVQPAFAATLKGGATSLSQFIPAGFWWWLFIPSYLLMVWGLAMTTRSTPSRGG
jgi:hypothetical protein